jgi:hypothetical protein
MEMSLFSSSLESVDDELESRRFFIFRFPFPRSASGTLLKFEVSSASGSFFSASVYVPAN